MIEQRRRRDVGICFRPMTLGEEAMIENRKQTEFDGERDQYVAPHPDVGSRGHRRLCTTYHAYPLVLAKKHRRRAALRHYAILRSRHRHPAVIALYGCGGLRLYRALMQSGRSQYHRLVEAKDVSLLENPRLFTMVNPLFSLPPVIPVKDPENGEKVASSSFYQPN